MTVSYANGIYTSGTTWTLVADQGKKPADPPGDALIMTRAVQTKEGWRGQVVVAGRIAWESENTRSGETAIDLANARVGDAFTNLFA